MKVVTDHVYDDSSDVDKYRALNALGDSIDN